MSSVKIIIVAVSLAIAASTYAFAGSKNTMMQMMFFSGDIGDPITVTFGGDAAVTFGGEDVTFGVE